MGVKLSKLLMVLLIGLVASCTSKDSLKKMLADNPDILTEAIEKNPSAILESLNKAVKKAQEGEEKKRDDEEKKQLEASFSNPLTPVLRADESYRGSKDGVITLVEYSDFQCPYCSRGYKTVISLLEKYKDKIRFVYKHLPLSFHPQAMITSQYYEAIRLQSAEKAFKFHDKIYDEQKKLENGEAFLKEAAKSVGADMGKLAKDVNSEAVIKRIKDDEAEAGKYGFQGTPGFIINGIPVKGAYPVEHFTGLVDELVKRGKLKI
ncbi:MAG: thioredoxin domain-containing protein [Bacteriovoracaceae bacterium]|nr:thioredoxin domain-containing protein [Bacteriovoracaceae bacterium]